jgi:hypothetical protein
MPEAVNEVPVSDNMNAIRAAGKPRRLVLCFDGTSNKFQGDRSDTNIVKIYQMLDRNTSDQFHYYQRKADHYSNINMRPNILQLASEHTPWAPTRAQDPSNSFPRLALMSIPVSMRCLPCHSSTTSLLGISKHDARVLMDAAD